MSKFAKIGGGVLGVVLVAFGVKFALAGRVDDQQLIRQALSEALKASKEGRPGGVMEKLSFKVNVNGSDYSSRDSAIANYIKNNHPDVTFGNDRAVVTADEATIVTPATVKLELLGNAMERTIQKVTLVFHRENDYEWLIIPTKKWRLAEVRVPDNALSDMTGFGT